MQQSKTSNLKDHPNPLPMSLIHISKQGTSGDAVDIGSFDSSTPNDSEFIIVEGEVCDLPPPKTRLGVDPRLETTASMINAIEEKQKKLFTKLNKLPEKLEKEADYSNKQINHLVAIQESSKKYLTILTGAVAVLAAIAAGRLAYIGVGLWKRLRQEKSTSALEGTEEPRETGSRRRRLHQRDWRISEAV